jgi:hypothetical protein
MVWNVQAYRKNTPSGEPLGPFPSAEAAVRAANGAFCPAVDSVLVYHPEHRDQAFLRLKNSTREIARLARSVEQQLRKAEAKVSSKVLMTKPIDVDWTGRSGSLEGSTDTFFEAKVNGATVAVHVAQAALDKQGEVSCKDKAREKLEQAAKSGAIPNPLAVTLGDFAK